MSESAVDRPAGLLRRLAAIVYDGLLLLALWLAAGGVWVAAHGGRAVAPGDWPFRGYLLAVAFAFFGGFWVLAGRTLGMQAWRMRVVDERGGAIGWGQALARFAAAALSWALLGVGFLCALLDPERRTLHDRLSGTRLVVLANTRESP